MRKIICFIIAFIILLFFYARYGETARLVTKEYVIKSDYVLESYDGFKIIHFSDLHYKRLIDKKRLNKILEEINIINPDIVVFTGDLIDKDSKITTRDKNILIDFLNNINATYGKYSVMGNHDYKKEKVVKEIYDNTNFNLLKNTYDIIYNSNNDKIFIGGLDNVSYKKQDIDKVMNYFSTNDDISYKIILVHEPDYTDTILKKYDNINLILAGHSHDGQVKFPFIGATVLPKYARKYYENYYQINNTDLYISSGLGLSSHNFRFLNPPSINFYRINKN